MIKSTETIRDFYGVIIGFIETDDRGDKTARDFYRRIIGYYDKKQNVTRDFYHKIVAKGDAVVGLVYAEHEKATAQKTQQNAKK